MRVITGSAKGVHLKAPDGLQTRPTTDRVKEALFSAIQFDIQCTSVLDLFGGSGQLGIEALSRGAKRAVFVDHRKESIHLIKENLKRTKLEQSAAVVLSDYRDYLKNCREKFGIIFLDPPYAESFLENSLQIISEIDILVPGGIIVAERPAGKPLDVVLQGFSKSKDYRYGKTMIAIFRKDSCKQETI